MASFVMAGGGTGGHVIPAIAVAEELRRRGHEVTFVGTRQGMEAKLVPEAGFAIDWIQIGGLNRVGLTRQVKTLAQLPLGVWRAMQLLRQRGTCAVFSMGGYVAGPVMLAAALMRLPLVVMEPNAIPGFAVRHLGPVIDRALLNFRETTRYFPEAKVRVTGLPVRQGFFDVAAKSGGTFTLLVTGGSRGARSLNRAVREAWPQLRAKGWRVLHQTGAPEYADMTRAFAESGVEGEVVAFIADMPAAFQEADVVLCRSGAGAVAELCAAGKPAILVPFPFAADDHQWHNAQAMRSAGAARLIEDKALTASTLLAELQSLASDPLALATMGEQAKKMAHPKAAESAADELERLGGVKG